MAYSEMVALKTVRELVAMKNSLELSADDVGCFSADDPELLQAVKTELERRAGQITKDYWACECEGFHFQSRDKDKCPKCGARNVDSADCLEVDVEEEMQSLIRAMQCLKEDDVYMVLDNVLPPEMKARLKWPPRY